MRTLERQALLDKIVGSFRAEQSPSLSKDELTEVLGALIADDSRTLGSTMSQSPVQEGFSSLLKDLFEILSKEVESDEAAQIQIEIAQAAHRAMRVTI